MVMPNKGDCLPFDNILVVAKKRFDIDPDKFWKMTFGEFWPLYNGAVLKTQNPMTSKDLKALNDRWTKRGKFRGTSS